MRLQPVTQSRIYFCLPACARCAELFQHIGRQADCDALFGHFGFGAPDLLHLLEVSSVEFVRIRVSCDATVDGFVFFPIGTIVPALSFGIQIHLSRICLAQADDAPLVVAVYVDGAVQPHTDIAQRDHAAFLVLPTHIFAHQGFIPFELFGFGQRNAMLALVAQIFGGVECDFHIFIACTLSVVCKDFLYIRFLFLPLCHRGPHAGECVGMGSSPPGGVLLVASGKYFHLFIYLA